MPSASQTPRDIGVILGREQPAAGTALGFASAQPAAPPRGPGQLITYDGDGHLLTFAPTGAGKGVGPVICNALTHPGQLIVIDIKGEVYRATAARRRAMGQDVHLLDLNDGAPTDGLNPIDLARMCGSETATVARSFAGELVERTGNERESFWLEWAETMIAGGVGWLMDDCAPDKANLGTLFDLLTSDDPIFKIASYLDNKTIKSRSAYSAFAAFLNLSERETRPSVLASAQAPLRLFDSELIRRLTERTTIDLEGLVAGKPMSIYITVPPMRLTTYRPLLRCWISGLIFALMQLRAAPPHRTLLLCDELGNLGRIDALLTAFTLLRSSGVTIWGFLQNPSQLDIYGSQARTILDNAGVVQMFNPRNNRMAQDFASMVGGIDSDRIMAMAADEQLLLIEGGAPRRARKLRYFADPEFAGLYEDNFAQRGR
jgi:type IV secretion system protein VirD4